MSRLDEKGNVVFEAPVSTMNDGSLERGQYAVPLRWPGQHGMYNFPLDQLARRMYERGKLAFFCCREILFHGKELDTPQRAASLDPIFGVRMTWPYMAKKGERYVFTFYGEAPAAPPGVGMSVNDLEMPDVILVNGRKLWERESGKTLFVNVEYVAPSDGPMEITLVKDTYRTWRDSQAAYGFGAMTSPVCRGYTHLHMGLRFACEHFGPTDLAPTLGEPYELPQGLRTFPCPGIWSWVPDEETVAYDYPPVVAPEYPTDGVLYNQFHDLYLDDPERFERRPAIWDNPKAMRDIVRLSLDNGIRSFPQTGTVLETLEYMGLADDPIITIFFSGGYIKRKRGVVEETYADQKARRDEEGRKLADVMRRFPNSPVIYRLNEFSGCQYCHVVAVPEERERAWPKPWYEFAKAADELNREALDEVLEQARAVDPDRIQVAANVQTGHLAAHPLHCGADFILEKTIGRNQVNLVIADSRGVNTAFDRTVGLQHDAWGGLNYNRDSAREIESVHRSFFFNGGEFHDAEFGDFAVTQDGRGALNRKGLAWIKVTRFAAIHPRRGRQRVKIAYMRGSDQVWGWYYPLKHTMSRRGYDGFDPADPKEYVDFNLLNVAFPEFGDWLSWTPDRWMTGTPFGPCDLLPWDGPAEALKRYDVIAMLGANKLEEACRRNYLDYVASGGTMVMGLYQLLSPTRDRVYFKDDVSDLLGVRLGEDVPLFQAKTLLDYMHFQSRHYNRVELAGAEIVETLPNGDPLLVKHSVGEGNAYLFTTDRLTTVPGAAEQLLRSLFEPRTPVALDPPNDRMEIAVSEKGDVRIIALMDHGRDCLPTDAGEDTGPYAGTVTLALDNLGMPEGDVDVLLVSHDEKITALRTSPADFVQHGRRVDVNVRAMGPWMELVVGPKGATERGFFWE